MINRLGLRKTLLFFTLFIGAFVVALASLLITSNRASVNHLSVSADDGLKAMQIQLSMTKALALMHSNNISVTSETDKDARDVRMEISDGLAKEVRELEKKCGTFCADLSDDFEKYSKTWTDIQQKFKASGNMDIAKGQVISNLTPLAESLFDKLDKKGSQAYKAANTEFTTAAETNHKSQRTLIIITGIFLACILGAGFLIQRKVTSLAFGVADSVLESVSRTTDKTQKTLESSDTLSSASSTQASAVEETVASIEELSSMVQKNAENAKSASDLSQHSTEKAELGGREILNLIGSMREISDSSKKMSEIINVIDDIAFQTNLLALNAAVEAARAGEQGRGFAVVAEAVRNLAQRSAGAAKEIGSLIKESSELTDRGSSVADKSNSALQDIISSIKKMSELNREIASASAEQSVGIQQITKAMNQIDQTVQTNNTVSNELKHLATDLMSETERLQTSSHSLMELIKGRANSPAAADVHHLQHSRGEKAA
jgi:methyl-accepting chemotaxis protein